VTVYVDRLESWGWVIRGRTTQSCHMFIDGTDLEELHVFAERIGLKRQWFQDKRIAPHYDLTPSRRALAVKLGAVEVLERKAASAIWRARREKIAGLVAADPQPVAEKNAVSGPAGTQATLF
jgi:hypothetical protein